MKLLHLTAAAPLALGLVLISDDSPAGLTAWGGNTFQFQRYGYDYGPSAMYGDGLNIKMWWMGANNYNGDSVMYSEFTQTGWLAPQTVLCEGVYAPNWDGTCPAAGTWPTWDSTFVGDPSVIKGNFSAGGGSYTYAMYYTGCCSPKNNVGVAFSNDGKQWTKYAQNPIILASGPHTDCPYGAGMPTAYRDSSSGLITVAYFDCFRDELPPNGQQFYARNFVSTSMDGVTFTAPVPLPTPIVQTGQGGDAYAIGDIARDGSTWLVTTKWNTDQEIYVYRTPTSNLATGPWATVGSISPTTTGRTFNHNPGWLRWPNGDIRAEPNTLNKYIYYGAGNTPAPGAQDWEISQSIWLDVGWEFNNGWDTEGWTPYNIGAQSHGAGNCWIFATPSNSDPHIDSRNIEAYAASFKNIEFPMANTNANLNGKIYFRTDSWNSYEETKTVTFSAYPNDGTWPVKHVYMGANPYWTGKITGIRIDPVETGTGGNIGIDWIHLIP